MVLSGIVRDELRLQPMDQPTPWRFARVCTDGTLQWRLRRNCSVSPAQLLSLVAVLAMGSLAVAMFFWWRGARLVLPFTVLELLALVGALWVYARHATDGDVVSLSASGLCVEQEEAGRVTTQRFERTGLNLLLPRQPQDLIEIRWGHRAVRVGRHVRPELRGLLGREIQQAVLAGVVGNP